MTEVKLIQSGGMHNLMVSGNMVASYDETRGELCVYEPGDEEPSSVLRF